mgnify:CR=1 FL=1
MIKLPGPYQRLKKSHPKVFRAYEKLGETAADSGPLDLKMRELIKLGMAAAMRRWRAGPDDAALMPRARAGRADARAMPVRPGSAPIRAGRWCP